MSSLTDEEAVVSLWSQKGLDAQRFSKAEKRLSKTPDFRVFKDGCLKFYCEVKTVMKDSWLDKKLDEAQPGTLVGGVRDDPVFNRLTDDIHTAAAQLRCVNPHAAVPNVLVFVNHDSMCDESDMNSVLTGHFIANDGSLHPIYKKFSDGRISDEKQSIHLFCWVQDGKFRSFVFNQANPTYTQQLCELLGYELAGIESIYS